MDLARLQEEQDFFNPTRRAQGIRRVAVNRAVVHEHMAHGRATRPIINT